jgi:hypothetical protein
MISVKLIIVALEKCAGSEGRIAKLQFCNSLT